MVFLSDGSIGSLRSLKVMLRWVERSSCLNINYSKSAIFLFNKEARSMVVAENFLNCKRGVVPFYYLGITIDTIASDTRVWEPVVEKVRMKLCLWRSRKLSITGQVTLINVVLNVIPTFMLSFIELLNPLSKPLPTFKDASFGVRVMRILKLSG
ncbi:hypothetical protein ACS0TY_028191 [Phlomoides rotata]